MTYLQLLIPLGLWRVDFSVGKYRCQYDDFRTWLVGLSIILGLLALSFGLGARRSQYSKIDTPFLHKKCMTFNFGMT